MRILIVTDGSKFSEAAIEVCPNIIAEPARAAIKVISTFEFPTVEPFDPMTEGSVEFYDQFEEAEHAQATEYAEQAATHIRSLFPNIKLDLTTQVIQDAPQRAIIETAESWKADLIVVGSHGYGFWERALLGSVSSSIVHHAPCSVLVVRAGLAGSTKDS